MSIGYKLACRATARATILGGISVKMNEKHIRYRVCRELLLYRALYYKYIKEPYILSPIIDRIWLHYKIVQFIYECGLISVYTIKRSRYMFNRIKKRKL